MLWLLLTGQTPTEAQTRDLSRELAENGDLPKYMEQLIDACVQCPKFATSTLMSKFSLPHFMTQLPKNSSPNDPNGDGRSRT